MIQHQIEDVYVKIRPAVSEDAAEVVALRATVYPYLVRGVESTHRMIAHPPPGEDWVAFVAEADGHVVGWASAFRNTSTSEANFGEIALPHVHPDHRRQGAGSALLQTGLDHLRDLDVRRVRTWALEQSLDFARKRGFEASRQLRYSARPIGLALPEPFTPDGIDLVPLSDLEPPTLYAAHIAASSDEPGDVSSDAISYDNWRYEVWDNLGLDRDASVAAIMDGTVVSFTLVKRDGERMWSDMTATLPQHRGRGLALLAKVAALRRAAERGVTMAYTSNDESNAPMLAINARLGYQPVATQWSCLTTLS